MCDSSAPSVYSRCGSTTTRTPGSVDSFSRSENAVVLRQVVLDHDGREWVVGIAALLDLRRDLAGRDAGDLLQRDR